MNDPSKQIVNWKNVSTTEEKIAELETNCKTMSAELEKLKAELATENETVWIPEFSDSYMYINSSGGVFSRDNNASDNDNRRIDFNNVYRPNDKTREHLKWYSENVLCIQNKLMQLHELLCPDYFPDWNNNIAKCFVYYNYYTKKYEYVYHCTMNIFTIYFTEDAAKKACEILNREKFMI